jgi:hypothetical protein
MALALVEPPATVMLVDGAKIEESLVARVTITPDCGAGPFSVTVTVAVVPVVTNAGLTLTDLSRGNTVTEALRVMLLYAPVRVMD